MGYRDVVPDAHKMAYKIQKTVNAPCWGCNERTAECHGTCEKYLEYRDTLHQKKREVWLAFKEEAATEDYVITQKAKNKKRTHRGRKNV